MVTAMKMKLENPLLLGELRRMIFVYKWCHGSNLLGASHLILCNVEGKGQESNRV